MDGKDQCGICKHLEYLEQLRRQGEPGYEDCWCYMFREPPIMLPCGQYDDHTGTQLALWCRAVRESTASLIRLHPEVAFSVMTRGDDTPEG